MRLGKKIAAFTVASLMLVGLLPANLRVAKADTSATTFTKANVAAGEVIATDGPATFTAIQDLQAQDKSVTVGENTYEFSLKSSGKNNAKVGSSKARAFGVITATAEAEVVLTIFMGNGKTGYVFESDTDLAIPATDTAPVALSADDALFALVEGSSDYTFTAKAGKYYYLVGVGTNLEVMNFTATEILKDPEMGKKYAINFATMTTSEKLNGFTSDDKVFAVTSSDDKAYVHDTSHGAALYNGDVIEVKVAGAAVLNFTLCQYGHATAFKVYDAAGNEVGAVSGKAASDSATETVNYNGAAGTLKIICEASGESYLHSIEVENLDTRAKAENFTFIYDENAVGGVVRTGEYKFGDSILMLGGYTDNGNITQYTVKDDKKVTINGVDHDSYTAGKRHADSNNIFTLPGEGDGTLTVFTPAGKGMFTVYVNTSSFLRIHDFNADGTKNGTTDTETAITEYSFEVLPGHVYVISTTGKTNNCYYAGYEYVVDKTVTVPVTITNVDATVTDALKLSLVDAKLGGKEITVKLSATSLQLLEGHTYELKTNDGGVKALVGKEATFVAAEEPVAITLNNVADETLTGKITGTDVSKVTKLVFTNMVNGVVVEAVIEGDSYTATMKPGEYSASVETTNGGVTYDRVSVKAGATNVDEVYVEVADPASARDFDYKEILNLETTGTVKEESGKAHAQAAAGATIKIPVTGKAIVSISTYYSANIKVNGEEFAIVDGDAAYHTTSKTKTGTFIVDGDITIEIVETSYITAISVLPIVPFKSEINVPGDYDSLNAASNAILGMLDRPEGEAGRVTINLKADLFEQVVMAAPYVTLKGNGHTISWYYGVGTNYYSINPATGLYSERLARDKYSFAEGNGNLWGGVFIVRGNNFIAEDTTFKNTYNYELTEAEKTDIAGTNLAVDRLAPNADVTAYAYKERSNAFYVDADNIEIYNCKILSSQDTFGRNGSTNYNYHVYVKDSVIGGNVDYICGEFSALFENCELQWKSYKNDASNNAKIGYIVAPKTSPYVFIDCKVTTSGDEGEQTVSGKLGRTWGLESKASFINLETNGHIDAEATWGEMNGGEKSSAVFNVYNITNNGEAFATSAYTNNTKEAVEAYIEDPKQSVLNNWTPVHYPSDDPVTPPSDDPVTPPTGVSMIPVMAIVVLMAVAFVAVLFARKRKNA